MAKIRSLKPDFFISDQVTSVSFEARYFFQGLWVFGDDEGLIKNSPKSLKMQILPGDDVKVEPLITELVDIGLVFEVDSDQGPLLWTPGVQAHQMPKRITQTKFTGMGSPYSSRSEGKCSPHGTPAGGTRGEMSPSSGVESSGEKSSGGERNESEVADATRPDVERLLDLLDSELTRNGVKRLPKRNKTNRDAMRLMLDRDGIPEDQIEGAIRWCQADEFWRGNILSASKLREKYETLRAQAARGRRGPAVQDNLARLAQLEAEERAAEQREIEE